MDSNKVPKSAEYYAIAEEPALQPPLPFPGAIEVVI